MEIEIDLIMADWERLQKLPGAAPAEHLARAFRAWAAYQHRICWGFEDVKVTDGFSRRTPGGSWHVCEDVADDACEALRGLRGSFREQAFDAVSYYFTLYARLGPK
ncbi:MAG: hypothetical protein WBG50_02200 [Desulfomonilaceae bacterium]